MRERERVRVPRIAGIHRERGERPEDGFQATLRGGDVDAEDAAARHVEAHGAREDAGRPRRELDRPRRRDAAAHALGGGKRGNAGERRRCGLRDARDVHAARAGVRKERPEERGGGRGLARRKRPVEEEQIARLEPRKSAPGGLELGERAQRLERSGPFDLDLGRGRAEGREPRLHERGRGDAVEERDLGDDRGRPLGDAPLDADDGGPPRAHREASRFEEERVAPVDGRDAARDVARDERRDGNVADGPLEKEAREAFGRDVEAHAPRWSRGVMDVAPGRPVLSPRPRGGSRRLDAHARAVLEHSFSFLAGIGAARERRLWTDGLLTWEDYRAARRVRGIGAVAKAQHDAVLAVARAALPRDPAFFARVLPLAEHWRAFEAFGADAAYVDIETAQDGGVTVVGVHRRGRTTLLVRGRDLTADAVGAALAGATMLVTFNGASFDLPVLTRAGCAMPAVPHLDLMHALRKLGLRGGLKSIERQLGLARDDALDGLSGYDALILWARHERGERGALDTLLAYNRADVENMVPLAAYAARHLRDATVAPHLSRRSLAAFT